MSTDNEQIERPTVSMDSSLVNEIDGELEYGDSRAAWIREACRMRLDAEKNE